ncbi:MAG: hypothetical protein WC723_07020, partial [Candidatus Omnitrophota bacterium]
TNLVGINNAFSPFKNVISAQANLNNQFKQTNLVGINNAFSPFSNTFTAQLNNNNNFRQTNLVGINNAFSPFKNVISAQANLNNQFKQTNLVGINNAFSPFKNTVQQNININNINEKSNSPIDSLMELAKATQDLSLPKISEIAPLLASVDKDASNGNGSGDSTPPPEKLAESKLLDSSSSAEEKASAVAAKAKDDKQAPAVPGEDKDKRTALPAGAAPVVPSPSPAVPGGKPVPGGDPAAGDGDGDKTRGGAPTEEHGNTQPGTGNGGNGSPAPAENQPRNTPEVPNPDSMMLPNGNPSTPPSAVLGTATGPAPPADDNNNNNSGEADSASAERATREELDQQNYGGGGSPQTAQELGLPNPADYPNTPDGKRAYDEAFAKAAKDVNPDVFPEGDAEKERDSRWEAYHGRKAADAERSNSDSTTNRDNTVPPSRKQENPESTSPSKKPTKELSSQEIDALAQRVRDSLTSAATTGKDPREIMKEIKSANGDRVVTAVQQALAKDSDALAQWALAAVKSGFYPTYAVDVVRAAAGDRAAQVVSKELTNNSDALAQWAVAAVKGGMYPTSAVDVVGRAAGEKSADAAYEALKKSPEVLAQWAVAAVATGINPKSALEEVRAIIGDQISGKIKAALANNPEILVQYGQNAVTRNSVMPSDVYQTVKALAGEKAAEQVKAGLSQVSVADWTQAVKDNIQEGRNPSGMIKDVASAAGEQVAQQVKANLAKEYGRSLEKGTPQLNDAKAREMLEAVVKGGPDKSTAKPGDERVITLRLMQTREGVTLKEQKAGIKSVPVMDTDGTGTLVHAEGVIRKSDGTYVTGPGVIMTNAHVVQALGITSGDTVILDGNTGLFFKGNGAVGGRNEGGQEVQIGRVTVNSKDDVAFLTFNETAQPNPQGRTIVAPIGDNVRHGDEVSAFHRPKEHVTVDGGTGRRVIVADGNVMSRSETITDPYAEDYERPDLTSNERSRMAVLAPILVGPDGERNFATMDRYGRALVGGSGDSGMGRFQTVKNSQGEDVLVVVGVNKQGKGQDIESSTPDGQTRYHGQTLLNDVAISSSARAIRDTALEQLSAIPAKTSVGSSPTSTPKQPADLAKRGTTATEPARPEGSVAKPQPKPEGGLSWKPTKPSPSGMPLSPSTERPLSQPETAKAKLPTLSSPVPGTPSDTRQPDASLGSSPKKPLPESKPSSPAIQASQSSGLPSSQSPKDLTKAAEALWKSGVAAAKDYADGARRGVNAWAAGLTKPSELALKDGYTGKTAKVANALIGAGMNGYFPQVSGVSPAKVEAFAAKLDGTPTGQTVNKGATSADNTVLWGKSGSIYEAGLSAARYLGIESAYNAVTTQIGNTVRDYIGASATKSLEQKGVLSESAAQMPARVEIRAYGIQPDASRVTNSDGSPIQYKNGITLGFTFTNQQGAAPTIYMTSMSSLKGGPKTTHLIHIATSSDGKVQYAHPYIDVKLPVVNQQGKQVGETAAKQMWSPVNRAAYDYKAQSPAWVHGVEKTGEAKLITNSQQWQVVQNGNQFTTSGLNNNSRIVFGNYYTQGKELLGSRPVGPVDVHGVAIYQNLDKPGLYSKDMNIGKIEAVVMTNKDFGVINADPYNRTPLFVKTKAEEVYPTGQLMKNMNYFFAPSIARADNGNGSYEFKWPGESVVHIMASTNASQFIDMSKVTIGADNRLNIPSSAVQKGFRVDPAVEVGRLNNQILVTDAKGTPVGVLRSSNSEKLFGHQQLPLDPKTKPFEMKSSSVVVAEEVVNKNFGTKDASGAYVNNPDYSRYWVPVRGWQVDVPAITISDKTFYFNPAEFHPNGNRPTTLYLDPQLTQKANTYLGNVANGGNVALGYYRSAEAGENLKGTQMGTIASMKPFASEAPQKPANTEAIEKAKQQLDAHISALKQKISELCTTSSCQLAAGLYKSQLKAAEQERANLEGQGAQSSFSGVIKLPFTVNSSSANVDVQRNVLGSKPGAVEGAALPAGNSHTIAPGIAISESNLKDWQSLSEQQRTEIVKVVGAKVQPGNTATAVLNIGGEKKTFQFIVSPNQERGSQPNGSGLKIDTDASRALRDRTVEPGAMFWMETKVVPNEDQQQRGFFNIPPEKIADRSNYPAELKRAFDKSEFKTPQEAFQYLSDVAQTLPGNMRFIYREGATELALSFGANKSVAEQKGQDVFYQIWGRIANVDADNSFGRECRQELLQAVNDRFGPAVLATTAEGFTEMGNGLEASKTYNEAVGAWDKGTQLTTDQFTNTQARVVTVGYGRIAEMFQGQEKMKDFNPAAEGSQKQFLLAIAVAANPELYIVNNQVNRLGFDYQNVGNVPQANGHFGSVELPNKDIKYLFVDGGLYNALNALGTKAGMKAQEFDAWFANRVADPMFVQGKIPVSDVGKMQAAWGNSSQPRPFDYQMTSGHNVKATYQFGSDAQAQVIKPNPAINDFSANVSLNQIQVNGVGDWHTLSVPENTSKILLRVDGLNGENVLYTHSGEMGSISKLPNGFTGFNGSRGVTYAEVNGAALQDRIQGKISDIEYGAQFGEKIYIGYDNPSGNLQKLVGEKPSFVGTEHFAGLTTRVATEFTSKITGVVSAEGCASCQAQTNQPQELKITTGEIDKSTLEGTSYLRVSNLELTTKDASGKPVTENLKGLDVMATANGRVLFGERPADLNYRMAQLDSGWVSPIRGELGNEVFKPTLPEQKSGGKPSENETKTPPPTSYQTITGQIGFAGRVNIELGLDNGGNLKADTSKSFLQPSLVDNHGFAPQGTEISVKYVNAGTNADKYKEGMVLPWNVRMVGHPEIKGTDVKADWRDLRYSNVTFYGLGNGQVAGKLTEEGKRGWEYGGKFENTLKFKEGTYGGEVALTKVNWERDFKSNREDGYGYFSNKNLAFDGEHSSYTLNGIPYAGAIKHDGDALVVRHDRLSIEKKAAELDNGSSRAANNRQALPPSLDAAPYQSVVTATRVNAETTALRTPSDKISLPAINADNTVGQKEHSYGIGLNLSPNMGSMQASLVTENMVFVVNSPKQSPVAIGKSNYWTENNEKSAVKTVPGGFIPFHQNTIYQGWEVKEGVRALNYTPKYNPENVAKTATTPEIQKTPIDKQHWQVKTVDPKALPDGLNKVLTSKGVSVVNKGTFSTGWQKESTTQGKKLMLNDSVKIGGKVVAQGQSEWLGSTNGVLITNTGAPIFLFQTAEGQSTFTLSPYMLPQDRKSEGGSLDNSGIGTNVTINPANFKGAYADLVEATGRFGVQIDTNNDTFDANRPMFSPGAQWTLGDRTIFNREQKEGKLDNGATTDIGEKYNGGIRVSPNLWVGRFNDVPGEITIVGAPSPLTFAVQKQAGTVGTVWKESPKYDVVQKGLQLTQNADKSLSITPYTATYKYNYDSQKIFNMFTAGDLSQYQAEDRTSQAKLENNQLKSVFFEGNVTRIIGNNVQDFKIIGGKLDETREYKVPKMFIQGNNFDINRFVLDKVYDTADNKRTIISPNGGIAVVDAPKSTPASVHFREAIFPAEVPQEHKASNGQNTYTLNNPFALGLAFSSGAVWYNVPTTKQKETAMRTAINPTTAGGKVTYADKAWLHWRIPKDAVPDVFVTRFFAKVQPEISNGQYSYAYGADRVIGSMKQALEDGRVIVEKGINGAEQTFLKHYLFVSDPYYSAVATKDANGALSKTGTISWDNLDGVVKVEAKHFLSADGQFTQRYNDQGYHTGEIVQAFKGEKSSGEFKPIDAEFTALAHRAEWKMTNDKSRDVTYRYGQIVASQIKIDPRTNEIIYQKEGDRVTNKPAVDTFPISIWEKSDVKPAVIQNRELPLGSLAKESAKFGLSSVRRDPITGDVILTHGTGKQATESRIKAYDIPLNWVATLSHDGKGFILTPPSQAPVVLNQYFTTNVIDVHNVEGEPVTFRLDKTLIRENYDPNANTYNASPVLQADKLSYGNARTAEFYTIEKSDLDKGSVKIPGLGELTATFNADKKTYTLRDGDGAKYEGKFDPATMTLRVSGTRFENSEGTASFAVPLSVVETTLTNGNIVRTTNWFGAGASQDESVVTFSMYNPLPTLVWQANDGQKIEYKIDSIKDNNLLVLVGAKQGATNRGDFGYFYETLPKAREQLVQGTRVETTTATGDKKYSYTVKEAIPQLALNEGAGRLIQKTAAGKQDSAFPMPSWKPDDTAQAAASGEYFSVTKKVADAGSDSELRTQAKNIWLYQEMSNPQAGEKGWAAPSGRTYFNDSVNFELTQDSREVKVVDGKEVKGDWSEPSTAQIVAQDTRYEVKALGQEIGEDKRLPKPDADKTESVHYLIKDLKFVESRKEVAESQKQMPLKERQIAQKNTPSTGKLGYELDNRYTEFSNNKGIIDAKGALMPAFLGVDHNGGLKFEAINKAEGLYYKYQGAPLWVMETADGKRYNLIAGGNYKVEVNGYNEKLSSAEGSNPVFKSSAWVKDTNEIAYTIGKTGTLERRLESVGEKKVYERALNQNVVRVLLNDAWGTLVNMLDTKRGAESARAKELLVEFQKYISLTDARKRMAAAVASGDKQKIREAFKNISEGFESSGRKLTDEDYKQLVTLIGKVAQLQADEQLIASVDQGSWQTRYYAQAFNEQIQKIVSGDLRARGQQLEATERALDAKNKFWELHHADQTSELFMGLRTRMGEENFDNERVQKAVAEAHAVYSREKQAEIRKELAEERMKDVNSNLASILNTPEADMARAQARQVLATVEHAQKENNGRTTNEMLQVLDLGRAASLAATDKTTALVTENRQLDYEAQLIARDREALAKKETAYKNSEPSIYAESDLFSAMARDRLQKEIKEDTAKLEARQAALDAKRNSQEAAQREFSKHHEAPLELYQRGYDALAKEYLNVYDAQRSNGDAAAEQNGKMKATNIDSSAQFKKAGKADDAVRSLGYWSFDSTRTAYLKAQSAEASEHSRLQGEVDKATKLRDQYNANALDLATALDKADKAQSIAEQAVRIREAATKADEGDTHIRDIYSNVFRAMDSTQESFKEWSQKQAEYLAAATKQNWFSDLSAAEKQAAEELRTEANQLSEKLHETVKTKFDIQQRVADTYGVYLPTNQGGTGTSGTIADTGDKLIADKASYDIADKTFTVLEQEIGTKPIETSIELHNRERNLFRYEQATLDAMREQLPPMQTELTKREEHVRLLDKVGESDWYVTYKAASLSAEVEAKIAAIDNRQHMLDRQMASYDRAIKLEEDNLKSARVHIESARESMGSTTNFNEHITMAAAHEQLAGFANLLIDGTKAVLQYGLNNYDMENGILKDLQGLASDANHKAMGIKDSLILFGQEGLGKIFLDIADDSLARGDRATADKALNSDFFKKEFEHLPEIAPLISEAEVRLRANDVLDSAFRGRYKDWHWYSNFTGAFQWVGEKITNGISNTIGFFEHSDTIEKQLSISELAALRVIVSLDSRNPEYIKQQYKSAVSDAWKTDWYRNLPSNVGWHVGARELGKEIIETAWIAAVTFGIGGILKGVFAGGKMVFTTYKVADTAVKATRMAKLAHSIAKTGQLIQNGVKLGIVFAGIGAVASGAISTGVLAYQGKSLSEEGGSILGSMGQGVKFGYYTGFGYTLGGAILGSNAHWTLQGLTFAAINETVANAMSKLQDGKFIGFSSKEEVFTHALLVGSAFLTAIGRATAQSVSSAARAGKGAQAIREYNLANAASSSIKATPKNLSWGGKLLMNPALRNTTTFAATVFSQATLGGEIYLLTSAPMRASNGEPFSAAALWNDYKKGTAIGGLFGGIIGSGALASNLKFVQSMKNAAIWKNYPALATTAKLGGYTLGGVVLFPLAKGIIESERMNGDVFTNIGNNYYIPSDAPWYKNVQWQNIVAGGMIGLGIGWGFTPVSKASPKWLQTVQTWTGRGLLAKPGIADQTARYKQLKDSGHNSVSSFIRTKAEVWSLRAEKFLYGGVVGGSTKVTYGYLTGKYGQPNTSKTLDFLTGGLQGGLGALFLSAQSKNLFSSLKSYTAEGAMKPTQVIFGDAVKFAPANGPLLLHNQATAGAVQWIIVSPAFTVGGAMWNGLLNKVSWLTDRSANSDNGLFLYPIRNNADGTKDYVTLFSSYGLNALISSTVSGPRSGYWMKPAIELLQVKTETPGAFNQGGFATKITAPVMKAYYVIRNRSFIQGQEAFEKWSTERVTMSAASRIAGAADWWDTTVTWMPLYVSGIEKAVTGLDAYLVKQGYSDETGHYFSPAELEGLKWLPFFGYANFSPSSTGRINGNLREDSSSAERSDGSFREISSPVKPTQRLIVPGERAETGSDRVVPSQGSVRPESQMPSWAKGFTPNEQGILIPGEANNGTRPAMEKAPSASPSLTAAPVSGTKPKIEIFGKDTPVSSVMPDAPVSLGNTGLNRGGERINGGDVDASREIHLGSFSDGGRNLHAEVVSVPGLTSFNGRGQEGEFKVTGDGQIKIRIAGFDKSPERIQELARLEWDKATQLHDNAKDLGYHQSNPLGDLLQKYSQGDFQAKLHLAEAYARITDIAQSKADAGVYRGGNNDSHSQFIPSSETVRSTGKDIVAPEFSALKATESRVSSKQQSKQEHIASKAARAAGDAALAQARELEAQAVREHRSVEGATHYGLDVVAEAARGRESQAREQAASLKANVDRIAEAAYNDAIAKQNAKAASKPEVKPVVKTETKAGTTAEAVKTAQRMFDFDHPQGSRQPDQKLTEGPKLAQPSLVRRVAVWLGLASPLAKGADAQLASGRQVVTANGVRYTITAQRDSQGKLTGAHFEPSLSGKLPQSAKTRETVAQLQAKAQAAEAAGDSDTAARLRLEAERAPAKALRFDYDASSASSRRELAGLLKGGARTYGYEIVPERTADGQILLPGVSAADVSAKAASKVEAPLTPNQIASRAADQARTKARELEADAQKLDKAAEASTHYGLNALADAHRDHARQAREQAASLKANVDRIAEAAYNDAIAKQNAKATSKSEAVKTAQRMFDFDHPQGSRQPDQKLTEGPKLAQPSLVRRVAV